MPVILVLILALINSGSLPFINRLLSLSPLSSL